MRIRGRERAMIPRLLLSAFACAAMLIAGCSLGPVAGGGTETGNPEVVACARAAFAAMNADSQWMPEHYLPGGVQKLDPALLIPASTREKLAVPLGKAQARIDTVVNDTHYVYIDDTLLVRDTVIRTDTQYVNDTLISTRLVDDTIVETDSGDTSRYVLQRIVNDTVLVADTLVLRDTTVNVDTMLYRDTLALPDTSADWSINGGTLVPATYVDSSKLVRLRDMRPSVTWLVDSIYLNPPASENDSMNIAPVYLVMMDIAGARGPDTQSRTIDVSPGNYSVIPGLGRYQSLSKRYSTPSGYAVSEAYADRDGDGLLFIALPALVPAARYDCAITSPALDQSGSFDFCAGADRNFGTIDGNAISVFGRTTQSDDITEQAHYARDTASTSWQRMALSLAQAYSRDSVENITVRYLISRGDDSLGLADDRLLGVRETIAYRTGFLLRIDLAIDLTPPAARGELPRAGALDFIVTMRNGDSGSMTGGSIDLSAGTVRGEYRKTTGADVLIR